MNRLLIILCTFFLFLSGCSKNEPSAKTKKPSVEKPPAQLSVWLPEWQKTESVEDVKKMEKGINNIHIFAAYFNENDQLFLTDNALDILNQTQQNYSKTNKIILTVVNDQVKLDGTSSQKDVELLKRLLNNSTSRKQHIQDIIKLVDQYQINGIEIDYEKIPEKYIKKYTAFLTELHKQLKSKKKSLHVIVEPSFPFKTKLPNGPTYAVMAYNVYGYHSGPGPKATYKFLDKLLKDIKKSNQSFSIAFATGGFRWSENGKIAALTETEAESLLKTTGSSLKRDKASDAVHFKFIDENNLKNEVWYADQKTLDKWVAYVKKQKTSNIMIWRAGGLGENTLNWISEQK